MKVMILIFVLALQSFATDKVVVPPPTVQDLVTPFLDLRAQAEASKGEQQQAALQKSEKLLARLFKAKPRTSDEALVVLMNNYVGEALGPDLIHEVTARGRRMLPLLMKYRTATVNFGNKQYPSSLLLADDVRQENFANAVNSIKAGRVSGDE